MIVVESPEKLLRVGWRQAVFLAGGITGCPDWQAELLPKLSGLDVMVYNPRRAEWPMGDPFAAEAQISWEVLRLREADVISFWFPAATLCPIALYELGYWSAARRPRKKPLVVGVEPGYARELDVRFQTRLSRPEVEVVSTLDDLATGIKEATGC